MPAEPDAPEKRHGQHRQGQQAHGRCEAAERHRTPGASSRREYGIAIAGAAFTLFSPADDHHQREVDRHAEAEQNDRVVHE